MVPSASAWRAPAHVSVLRFVHDRNPFYLLSALCMFVGFRVILGALNSAPGDWKTLLGLIITLNVYEVVMIALALFLIVSRGLRRDGWILLGIEALFLVDLTNLNAELFTAMPRLGSVVNGLCFVLAIAKILIVVRVLDLRLPAGTLFYIAAQMAFLLGLPGMFRLMQSSMSTISPMQIYGIWWMVALLIVGGALLVDRSTQNFQSPMRALPWRLYVAVPLISLIVHLCSENRVYWVHFQAANVAPVLLALVVVLNQSQWKLHRLVLPVSLSMVMLSMALSIVPEAYQPALAGKLLGVAVSPLRFAMLGSAATCLYLAICQHSLLAMAALATGMVLASLGTSASEIMQNSLNILRWLMNLTKRLVPETGMQWGYMAIAWAFVLLGIGAAVSLHKAAPPPPEHEPVL